MFLVWNTYFVGTELPRNFAFSSKREMVLDGVNVGELRSKGGPRCVFL